MVYAIFKEAEEHISFNDQCATFVEALSFLKKHPGFPIGIIDGNKTLHRIKVIGVDYDPTDEWVYEQAQRAGLHLAYDRITVGPIEMQKTEKI